MDMTAMGGKIVDFLKKYRYVILVVLLGIGLMMIPGKKNDTPEVITEPTESRTLTDQTEALTEILSQIQGAGRLKLLLTYETNEKTVYQTDQDTSTSADSGSIRHETVIITDADRAQHGLIQQLLAPEYRGAIVVCQGAEDPAVRLAIVEAVSNATGLGTDRISVLKMK